ncbi:hypothetical protein U1Q18_051583 [Sarracenia purpurea var. burkii]
MFAAVHAAVAICAHAASLPSSPADLAPLRLVTELSVARKAALLHNKNATTAADIGAQESLGMALAHHRFRQTGSLTPSGIRQRRAAMADLCMRVSDTGAFLVAYDERLGRVYACITGLFWWYCLEMTVCPRDDDDNNNNAKSPRLQLTSTPDTLLDEIYSNNLVVATLTPVPQPPPSVPPPSEPEAPPSSRKRKETPVAAQTDAKRKKVSRRLQPNKRQTNTPSQTDCQGCGGEVIVVDELAYVSPEFLLETVFPVLEVANCALLGISTPLDEFNFFSKLLALRDENGEPFFHVIRLGSVCDACKKLPQEKCSRATTRSTRSQVEVGRQAHAHEARLRGHRPPAMALRENAGEVASDHDPVFDVEHLRQLFDYPEWRSGKSC